MSDPVGLDRRRKNPLPLKPGGWHWAAFAVILIGLLVAWRLWHR